MTLLPEQKAARISVHLRGGGRHGVLWVTLTSRSGEGKNRKKGFHTNLWAGARWPEEKKKEPLIKIPSPSGLIAT